MANQPFDREVWNPRERPYSSDNNREAGYAELALRAALSAFATPRVDGTYAGSAAVTPPRSGFFGEGFRCRAPTVGPSFNQLTIAPGIGFAGGAFTPEESIGGVIGVDDVYGFKPLVLSAQEIITLVPNATAFSRIDLIEVRPRKAFVDSANRDVLDTGTGVFINNLVDKTFTWEMAGQQGTVTQPANSTAPISYKVGIASGAPAVPPTTAGYTPIAFFRILGGAPGFTDPEQLADSRITIQPYGMQEIHAVMQFDPNVANSGVLLEFGTPPGMEAPKFSNVHPVANNTFVSTLRLLNPGLAGAVAANRVTYNVEMLGAALTQFPFIVANLITVPGGEIRITVQGILLQTAAGALSLVLGSWIAAPVILRFRINYW